MYFWGAAATAYRGQSQITYGSLPKFLWIHFIEVTSLHLGTIIVTLGCRSEWSGSILLALEVYIYICIYVLLPVEWAECNLVPRLSSMRTKNETTNQPFIMD